MCLTYIGDLTRETRRRLRKNESIPVYKVYQYRIDLKGRGRLLSPYQGSPVVLKRGEILSSRHDTSTSFSERQYGVRLGLHAFLTDDGAEGLRAQFAHSIIVELQAKAEDFVAAGEYGFALCAVFTKLTITPEEQKRVAKLTREIRKKLLPAKKK